MDRPELEAMGPFGFQDLAAALLVSEFGSGLHVMGRGRDGGRDLYTDEPLRWTNGRGAEWTGRTVFQVKQKATLGPRPADNAAWLVGQIRTELRDWLDADERPMTPKQLVFVTNVPLSPVPESGGHDMVRAGVEKVRRDIEAADSTSDRVKRRKERLARLERIEVLSREWVLTGLRVHDAVRLGFPALVTAGDVLAAFGAENGIASAQEIGEILSRHARTQLTTDGSIWLEEAGDPDASRLRLHDFAVDVPVVVAAGTRAESRRTLAAIVLERAQQVRRRSLAVREVPRHLVVTGAPGNGKTTMSKLLVQAFRCSLLSDVELSTDQRRIVEGTTAALDEVGVALPAHTRWPLRVDLAKFAEAGRFEGGTSLLKAIGEHLSDQMGEDTVNGAQLGSWLRAFPWFLVLDGLDEVTDPQTRRQLIERVEEFVNDAEVADADLLLVLTTRPLGYNDEIGHERFERIDLDYLTPDEGLAYGERATAARLHGDPERTQAVIGRLRRAAEEAAYVPLFRTPLQVLFLTIVLESSPRLAPDRYSLFRGYFDTVYKREASKTSAIYRLLDDYGPQIFDLHVDVAIELQVRNESGSSSDATLSTPELRERIWKVLADAGYDPTGTNTSAIDSLYIAATHRLVLITARGDEGFGFDVRSLQELMAGLYLVNAQPELVIARLTIAAPSPHWRNAWLFAAGSIFAGGHDHMQELLVSLVEDLDEGQDSRLSGIFPVAPQLALDIIDDGMVRNRPALRARLFAVALRVLDRPMITVDPAVTLIRAADTWPAERDALKLALAAALRGDAITRGNAEILVDIVRRRIDEGGLAFDTRVLGQLRRDDEPAPAGCSETAWSLFDEQVATAYVDGEDEGALLRTARAIRSRLGSARVDARILQDVATKPHALAALQAALAEVVTVDPALIMTLQKDLWPAISRAPVGHSIRRAAVDGGRASRSIK